MAVALGRRGGLKGGKARAASMTAEARSEAARHAVVARWEKQRKQAMKYWMIQGKECEISLQPRPAYCDRGNYVAVISVEGELALNFDSQDAWPRYYFDLERAKLEIVAWLRKRRQWVTDTFTEEDI